MSVDQFLLSSDTTDLNYPEIRPTLYLNFARVKALDPRITFTRSSGGSYVGADGLIKYAGVNEARFDHDPVTGESLGLLIEESRQNLLLQSNGFDTASWSKTSVTLVSNSITSPDGTTNAYKSVENTTTNLHRTQQLISKSAVATTYTFSVFVKSGERNGLEFGMSDLGGYVDCFTNASTGTFTGVPAINGSWVLGSYGSIAYPNGWYRFYVTATTTAQTGVNPFFGTTRTPGVANTYQGDGTSGIYVWGAQLEVGAFPTSYIPTQESSRTRAADNASMTGTNFSSWYNSSEGTFFTQAKSIATISGASRRFLEVSIGGAHQRYLLGYSSTSSTRFLVTTSSINQVDIITIANPSAGVKMCASYAANNFSSTTNGTLATRDIQGSVPTVDRMIIGWDNITTNAILCGTIGRLTYYPKALPQSQLQALTR